VQTPDLFAMVGADLYQPSLTPTWF